MALDVTEQAWRPSAARASAPAEQQGRYRDGGSEVMDGGRNLGHLNIGRYRGFGSPQRVPTPSAALLP